MDLQFKPDWEQTKERYRVWWAHEYFGRCAMAVCALRDESEHIPQPPKPSDPVTRWTDLDYITALNECRLHNIYWGGEAFPVWNGGYPGHTAIPAFLGCPTTLDWNTGWWDPILTDEDFDATTTAVDRSGRWWPVALALLRRAVKECPGKAIPSIGAFGGSGDTLAALRGSDRLLYDVVDRPGRVRAAEKHLMDMWFAVYDEFYAITRDAAEGSTCWFELWAPGKFYAVQNDFSYMISPAMFREIFLPDIERQTQFLDYAVYHVDGVEAFAHVPALCELPRLQAIQILPGAGKPSPLHYLDTLRYVQRAGKNLHIGLAPDEVETALSLLSARGLFISTWCRTVEEAQDLLKNAERWSVDRR